MIEFGKGSHAHEYGIDLEYITSWLDVLVSCEQDSMKSEKGKKYQRYLLVQNALIKLEEALTIE